MVDINEEHGGSVKEKHTRELESMQICVEGIRNKIKAEPRRDNDAKDNCGGFDLVVGSLLEPCIFYLVDKSQVLQRVEQRCQVDNWLRVSDTAERSQVDQCIGHQLHAIVPLLDTFKSE